MQTSEPIKKTIYKCYVGSYAHGLYMSEEEFGDKATCDIDTQEFFAYPLEWYLSLESYVVTHRHLTYDVYEGKFDLVGHEIRKAIHLMAKGNPNMLVPMFCNESSIIEISPAGQYLRDNRELFLGKDNIKERFMGYAFSQLDRMQKGAYRGYMGERRKKLVETIGYDTKNAMTLIRLMNEAVEALQRGYITVDKQVQGTRDYYLAIKLGEWTLDEVKQEAHRLRGELETAYYSSKLPQRINWEKINKLCNEVMIRAIG